MSDWNSPGAGMEAQSNKSPNTLTVQGRASRLKKSFLVPQVKDALMLVGWIAGLILIAGLCWFLTQPARTLFLRNAVNRVLEESGDLRRLNEPVSPAISGSAGMGVWYTMTEISTRTGNTARGESSDGKFSAGTRAFIFTFIGEGNFFPCAAIVNPEGKVQEFIPLNKHGAQIIKLISPGIVKIYTQRIEGDKT